MVHKNCIVKALRNGSCPDYTVKIVGGVLPGLFAHEFIGDTRPSRRSNLPAECLLYFAQIGFTDALTSLQTAPGMLSTVFSWILDRTGHA